MILVELDGTPVRPAESDPATGGRNGTTSGGSAARVLTTWPPTSTSTRPDGDGFPTQDDLDWLAATEAQERAEREQIEPGVPGRLRPMARPRRRRLPPRNQVSPDELSMLAAGMAL